MGKYKRTKGVVKKGKRRRRSTPIPILCYICKSSIQELFDLQRKDAINNQTLIKKATETAVKIPHKGEIIYRHNNCDPVSTNRKEKYKNARNQQT